MAGRRQKTRIRRLLWTIGLILASTAACGYHFSGGGELPEGIQRLNISVFENRSGETGIETLVTNDIVNQFIRFDTVELVEKGRADAILTGTIRSARIRTISHISPSRPAERRITLYLEIALKTPEGRVIWSAHDISASDSYDMSTEKRRTEQYKKSAIAKLSERLAERIYYRLTDEF